MPLFKLCPTKFQDKVELLNKETNKEINSHNSNSSMSSQTTNDESDHNLMTSSNEKVSNENEFIDLRKDNYLLISMSKSLSNNSADENLKILDICVDCYQMMDGVCVSINDSSNMMESQCKKIEDKNTFNSFLFNDISKKVIRNNNDEDDEENNNNDSNNSNNVTFSGSTSNSPDSIKMNSLINIDNVNTVNNKKISLENEKNIKTANVTLKTPLLNKFIPMTSTCHSTPTPTAQNINLDADSSNDIINENIDYGIITNSSNTKTNSTISRQHLTLDLQPVYKTKSP